MMADGNGMGSGLAEPGQGYQHGGSTGPLAQQPVQVDRWSYQALYLLALRTGVFLQVVLSEIVLVFETSFRRSA